MIGWALEALIGATLVMVVVLLARKPVARMFGANWAYALWLLPLLRLVLPPLPELSPLPVTSVTVIMPTVQAAAAPAATGGGAGDWLWLLAAVWAGGVFAFMLWQQSAYSAFLLQLGPLERRAVPPTFGGIKVVESEAVDGPIALGILARRIVVPVDFAARYTPVEQRLALEHELIHHKRLDLFWNWIALGVLTLNWFNPIAHFAFRAFRADQELACDATVARSAPEQRHDYACALVKSASRPGIVGACALNHASILKRRLRMMKEHRGGRVRAAGGLAAFLLLGAGGVALSTPAFSQRQPPLEARVVFQRANSDPAMGRAELRRLRQKCGSSDADAPIICTEEEARDPEVRAIIAKNAALTGSDADAPLDVMEPGINRATDAPTAAAVTATAAATATATAITTARAGAAVAPVAAAPPAPWAGPSASQEVFVLQVFASQVKQLPAHERAMRSVQAQLAELGLTGDRLKIAQAEVVRPQVNIDRKIFTPAEVAAIERLIERELEKALEKSGHGADGED